MLSTKGFTVISEPPYIRLGGACNKLWEEGEGRKEMLAVGIVGIEVFVPRSAVGEMSASTP